MHATHRILVTSNRLTCILHSAFLVLLRSGILLPHNILCIMLYSASPILHHTQIQFAVRQTVPNASFLYFRMSNRTRIKLFIPKTKNSAQKRRIHNNNKKRTKWAFSLVIRNNALDASRLKWVGKIPVLFPPNEDNNLQAFHGIFILRNHFFFVFLFTYFVLFLLCYCKYAMEYKCVHCANVVEHKNGIPHQNSNELKLCFSLSLFLHFNYSAFNLTTKRIVFFFPPERKWTLHGKRETNTFQFTKINQISKISETIYLKNKNTNYIERTMQEYRFTHTHTHYFTFNC